MSFKKNKAFTLIELLVVISIVGIISGIVVVQMNGAINAVNDSTKKTDLNTIKKALTIYQAETGNAYPSEAGCTIGSCTNLDSALGDLLPESFSNDYTYSSNGTSYTISLVLSSGYAYSYNSSTDSYTTAEPVAGSCGTANSKAYSSLVTSYGSDTICAVGTQNPTTVNFPDAGSSSSWTCVGANGGTTASCSASRYAAPTCPSSATCSTVGTDYVIKWTTVGSYTWTVPSGINSSVEYLVVGGGGGSSYYGGGGGAGGYKAGTTTVTTGSALAIEVGAGGTTTSTSDIRGTSGGQSKFDSIISAGGGGGGAPYLTSGGNGGSGGGGGGDWHASGVGGAGGSASAGNAGGAGGIGDGDHMRGSGGGGGAGSVGGAGTTSGGGAGGIGVVNDITGTDVWYAGGGGGAGYNSVGGAGTQTTGGGGAGEYYNGGYFYLPSTRNGINGTGGGAGSWVNGSGISVGGSGVVIVRLQL